MTAPTAFGPIRNAIARDLAAALKGRNGLAMEFDALRSAEAEERAVAALEFVRLGRTDAADRLRAEADMTHRCAAHVRAVPAGDEP